MRYGVDRYSDSGGGGVYLRYILDWIIVDCKIDGVSSKKEAAFSHSVSSTSLFSLVFVKSKLVKNRTLFMYWCWSCFCQSASRIKYRTGDAIAFVLYYWCDIFR